MSLRVRSIINYGITLLVGIALGVSGSDYMRRPPRPPRGDSDQGFQQLLMEYGKRLHLSDEQRDGVRAILSESQKQLLQLRSEVMPKIWAIESGMNEDIRKLLKEEQKRPFDEMLERESNHPSEVSPRFGSAPRRDDRPAPPRE